MSSEVYYRSWMDKPHLDPNTNLLTEEYVQGIGEFMRLVQQQPDAKSGFSRNYKVWYLHGETGYEYGSTSEPQPVSEPQPDISSSEYTEEHSTSELPEERSPSIRSFPMNSGLVYPHRNIVGSSSE
ncbi:hypothetical protein F2Q69_00054262 [Brassica cretica]|uniref:Uncharacterized protein n=1 Tax=Brassica cretica TaxID=69181 RepID=A0A8S9N6E8_BRACR|nr:hypothetical protein F2Q69_00054262 [Brassica cretica]